MVIQQGSQITVKDLYELKSDGKVLMNGTWFECALKLQRIQSQSYSYATKYEGYEVKSKIMSLLKIDSKNKIRILNIWSENGEVHREAGLLGGKLIDTFKPCKGKNIGRSNETTPQQQADKEVEAELLKKIGEGYVKIPHEEYDYSDEDGLRKYINDHKIEVPRPMLAYPFQDKRMTDKAGNVVEMLVSRKLDGMRCLAEIDSNGNVTMTSREGKPLEIFGHIEDQLKQLHKDTGWTGIFDGELYVHSEDDNFQAIMKACKKYREGVTEQIQYHIYDIINDQTAYKRWLEYQELLDTNFSKGYSHLTCVEQILVKSKSEGTKLDLQFITDGYEGSMWKVATDNYKPGKGYSLMKMKLFEDAEFLVVDVIPMDAWPNCGKFVCITKDGKSFNSTPKCSKEQKQEYLLNKHKYIDKMGTIKYFGITEDGIPRLNIFKGFRNEGDI